MVNCKALCARSSTWYTLCEQQKLVNSQEVSRFSPNCVGFWQAGVGWRRSAGRGAEPAEASRPPGPSSGIYSPSMPRPCGPREAPATQASGASRPAAPARSPASSAPAAALAREPRCLAPPDPEALGGAAVPALPAGCAPPPSRPAGEKPGLRPRPGPWPPTDTVLG